MIPTLFFVDKNGTILKKFVGFSDGSENEILEVLTDYLDDENISYDAFQYNKVDKKTNNVEIDADFLNILKLTKTFYCKAGNLQANILILVIQKSHLVMRFTLHLLKSYMTKLFYVKIILKGMASPTKVYSIA